VGMADIDVEDGRVSASLRTVLLTHIAVASAVITATVAVMGYAQDYVTKAQLKSAIDEIREVMVEHSRVPHRNEHGEKVSAPASLEDRVDSVSHDVRSLALSVDSLREALKSHAELPAHPNATATANSHATMIALLTARVERVEQECGGKRR
jgi:hypothetical protein